MLSARCGADRLASWAGWRFTLTIRLADYRRRAVIDWVQLDVELSRTTQALHVKRRIDAALGSNVHVELVEDEKTQTAKNSGRRFLVRSTGAEPRRPAAGGRSADRSLRAGPGDQDQRDRNKRRLHAEGSLARCPYTDARRAAQAPPTDCGSV